MAVTSLETDFLRYREQGDLEALERVFEGTAQKLLALALHWVRDAVEAEDLLQATFVTAIERADRYDVGRPLAPWLTGILSRHAANAQRKRRRQISLSGESGPDTLETSTHPGENLEVSELQMELKRALSSLAPPYREVLTAHLVEGRPAEEIARSLRRAPGTVRAQIYRGLRQLRRALPVGFASPALALPKGLAAIQSEVLQSAAGMSSATAGTTSIATWPLWIGAWIMKKSVFASLVGLTGLALLWKGTLGSLPEPVVEPVVPERPQVAALEPAGQSEELVLQGTGGEQREVIGLPAASVEVDAGRAIVWVDAEGVREDHLEELQFMVSPKRTFRPNGDDTLGRVAFIEEVRRAETTQAASSTWYPDQGLIGVDVTPYLEEDGPTTLSIEGTHEVYSSDPGTVDFRHNAFRRIEDGELLEERLKLTFQPMAVVRGQYQLEELRPDSELTWDRPSVPDQEEEEREVTFMVDTLSHGSGGVPQIITRLRMTSRTHLALFGSEELEPLAQDNPMGTDFQLRVPRGGRFELVLMRDNYPIFQQTVNLELYEVLELEDVLQIGRGQEILGYVEDFGLSPGGGLPVKASSKWALEEDETVAWVGETLAWQRGRLQRHSVQAETDEKGRFRIQGLRKDDYRLELARRGALLMFPDRGESFDVRPTVEGMSLTLPASGLVVNVQRADGRAWPKDGPSPRLKVSDSEGEVLGEVKLHQGRTRELILPPGQEVRLEARCEGFEFEALEVISASRGERKEIVLRAK